MVIELMLTLENCFFCSCGILADEAEVEMARLVIVAALAGYLRFTNWTIDDKALLCRCSPDDGDGDEVTLQI